MSASLPEAIGSVTVGRLCKFGSGVKLVATGNARIFIGNRCHIKTGTIINAYGGIVRIMDRVTFGEYCVVYGHGGVDINSGTAVAPHVVITAQEHILDCSFAVRFTGETASGISIGNNCLVSTRAVILDGISLGDHCVIGAGSVVTTSMPASYICFGVPCRPVRKIERNANYGWIDGNRSSP